MDSRTRNMDDERVEWRGIFKESWDNKKGESILPEMRLERKRRLKKVPAINEAG